MQRRLLFLIHRNLSFPERATVAPGNKRDKEHPMFDVVMLALGLGFVFGGGSLSSRLRTPLRGNENDFRLLTRRPRRCWLAVLLDLRPTTA